MKLLFKTLLLSTFLALIITVTLKFYPILASPLGVIPDLIPVSGTGSMYPTFPKGIGKTPQEQFAETVEVVGMKRYFPGIILFGKTYLKTKVSQEDIVAFENQKTKESTTKSFGQEAGLIKRVVGVGGDRISIRDGFLYLNDHLSLEPYIASARTTFGGEFLHDCEDLQIPQGSIFVMGDNRKGSFDSRDLGLVSLEDITHVLSFREQSQYASRWRDPANDKDAQLKTTLNIGRYYSLLNQKRLEKGLTTLNSVATLEESALKRAAAVINYSDFSTESKKSNYPLSSALKEVGYSNVLTGELIINGYFSEDELVENLSELPNVSNTLFNNDLQEIGLGEKVGKINGCETQIIVQHFGGFIPPNYSPKDFDYWQSSIKKIESSLPNWKALLGQPGINQEYLSKIVSNYEEAKLIAQNILGKMESNLWLTETDKEQIKKFEDLINESNQLADKINSQIIKDNEKNKSER